MEIEAVCTPALVKRYVQTPKNADVQWEQMRPWFRGFKGTVLPTEAKASGYDSDVAGVAGVGQAGEAGASGEAGNNPAQQADGDVVMGGMEDPDAMEHADEILDALTEPKNDIIVQSLFDNDDGCVLSPLDKFLDSASNNVRIKSSRLRISLAVSC